MAKYPARFAHEPGDRAARFVALTHLDAARVARGRLDASDDVEALHDFRVALRRLRSTLRAFRPVFGDTIPRKLRRRLRDLATATGGARDAEVQLAWGREARAKVPASRRAGVAWWLARLTEQRDAAYAGVRGEAAQEFDKLEPRLRRTLNASADGHAPATFGSVVSERLAAEANELEQRLALVRSAADDTEAHGARIEVKRIRYLLEPLAAEPPVAAALKQLRKAQDVLGALHDVQAVGAALGDAAAEAAAERTRELHRVAMNGASPKSGRRRAQPSPTGLLALARVARDQQDRLFRLLARGRSVRSLPSTLATLAAHLDTPPQPEPTPQAPPPPAPAEAPAPRDP